MTVSKIKSTENPTITFAWLITELRQKLEQLSRHVIFCKSIVDCARVHCAFLHTFGRNCSLFSMYHSKTPQPVKEQIKNDMANKKGNIRVLICTNSAGMGVNYAGLYDVIHYGPSQDLDTFVQQIGRAGRDGLPANQILIYNARQLRSICPELLCYIESNDECRRKTLVQMYINEPKFNIAYKHLCCDVCDSSCTCGEPECPNIHSYKVFLEKNNVTGVTDSGKGEVRTANTVQKKLLHSALVTYQTALVSEITDSELLIHPQLTHGFSTNCIDSIIENCNSLCTADDVLSMTNVWSYSQDKSVIDIFNKVFEIDQSDASENDEDSDDGSNGTW